MTPAFVLRRKPFRDNSLLLDLFTLEEGRISAVARFSKKQSARIQGMLEPFRLLDASWIGRGEVFTLTQTEERGRYPLSGKALIQGFYANELLLRAFAPAEPLPDMFQHYRALLSQLQHAADSRRLLHWELALLAHCGYELNLWQEDSSGADIEVTEWYRFRPDEGLMLADASLPEAQDTLIDGALLAALREPEWSTATVQALRQVVDRLWRVYLQGKTLYARELMVDQD